MTDATHPPIRWREPYSAAVRAHLREPSGVGRLARPDGVGEAGSARCGDQVRLEISSEGGRLTAARFLAYGCPAAIAAAAELAGRLPGLAVLEAARLGTSEVRRALDLPAAKDSCCGVAVDALHVALEDLVRRGAVLIPGQPDDGPPSGDPQAVVVGMSGGVDSSVAALRLREEGYRVLGVTFRLWSDPVCVSGRSCCSPETVLEARRLAHRLGVPHLTVDLSGPFYEQVVAPFIASYQQARTPNPCVRCNASLRFAALAEVADRVGAHWLATGHYARLVGAGRQLARGADRHKDQSYVLAEVPPALLRRARFPLGGIDKPAARAQARAHHLPTHDAPESQDICFIPDGDYKRFLAERLGEAPGSIVDGEGRVLGRHHGVYRYTIGQRKGLGVASAQPLYVVDLRPEEREVVVGPAAAADVAQVTVTGLVRHGLVPPEATAQLRSSGGGVPVTVEDHGDALILRLHRTVRGVAPGQAAVVYREDSVAAAGTIVATSPS